MDPSVQNTNPVQQPVQAPQRDKALEMLIPINRSGWAIAAGYLALFNIPFFITAPVAFVLGILGLLEIRKKPGLAGRGRCWFAIVYSFVVTVLFTIIIIASYNR